MTSWPFEALGDAARLTRLAEQVVGLFTRQQADRLGIDEVALRGFVAEGVVEAVDDVDLFRHLAYEFERNTEGLGAWLMLKPSLLADERGQSLLDQTEILSGGMAFELNGGSGPNYEPLFIVDRAADLASAPGSTILQRAIAPDDWSYVKGVPVANPWVAIADMIVTGEDEDYVRTCLHEAVTTMDLNLPRLIDLIDPVAGRYQAQSGHDLLLQLLKPEFEIRSRNARTTVRTQDSVVTVTRTIPLTKDAN